MTRGYCQHLAPCSGGTEELLRKADAVDRHCFDRGQASHLNADKKVVSWSIRWS